MVALDGLAQTETSCVNRERLKQEVVTFPRMQSRSRVGDQLEYIQ